MRLHWKAQRSFRLFCCCLPSAQSGNHTETNPATGTHAGQAARAPAPGGLIGASRAIPDCLPRFIQRCRTVASHAVSCWVPTMLCVPTTLRA